MPDNTNPPPPLGSWRVLSFCGLALFATAFVSIIAIANRGEGARYWGFLDQIPFGDKLGHVCLLMVFSVLLNTALGGRRAPGRLFGVMLGSIILLAMMTLEECSQFFIASRTFDGGDMIANVAGIAAGEAVVRLAARRWRRSPAQ